MHNNFSNTMGGPNPPGIVWQPVTMAPANTTNYNIGKKSTDFRDVSIISIVLGVLSIAIQIAALVIYVTSIYSYVYYPFDVLGYGIWCGACYLSAGSLGVAAYRKLTRSLLIATVVMSAISVAGAIVASTLSGLAAIDGVSYRCYVYSPYYVSDSDLCDAWLGLEWTLFSISILAFMNSIALVSLASVSLCCGGRNKDPQGNTNFTIGVGSNQQPMYYQPQPMYSAAQQHPNVQQAYYPQQQQFQFFQPNSEVFNVPQQQQQPTRHSQLLQQQQSQQKQPELPRLATSQRQNQSLQSEQFNAQPYTEQN
ncbi:uncharacterized protein LOC116931368 isoform X2 [Daphnia magna]|uniref:uncharacterized protein LOC116931368 isoform X2 n=1 Tax=Daphnia magna TaxID=35525 RepID=UPI001E1BAADC|nr:uncharacterized protein LOC116931368 isoform X2 [Daphnia magna]